MKKYGALKVLVTGANGFVGKNIVSRLKSNFSVNCLVRNKNYKNAGVKTYYFNTYEDKSLEDSVANSDVIIHTAALIHGKRKDMFSANVLFTKKLISLAKKHKIKHFIYISTENVEHDLNDIYTETKRNAEKEVKTFKNHMILRPTIMYGIGDEKYVTKLIRMIKKYPLIPVIGSGKNKFQFVHVQDLCIIIENAIKNNITGTYVVAGPESITYNDFTDLLFNEIGVRRATIKIPVPILKPIAHLLNSVFTFPPITPAQLDNISKNREYDIRKIVNIFKYRPTPLREGLQKLLKAEFEK
jgi:NADH dehydrogenase